MVNRLYKPGSARWINSAGNEATAPVALCITDDMMFWKPLVTPLSWFWMVVLRLMSPQIRLLFHPAPTPMERMPAAPLIDTALPPPTEYMTSSPMTLPVYWNPPFCANASVVARASRPASGATNVRKPSYARESSWCPRYRKAVEPRKTWPRRLQQL
ncbi:hypothetical protein VNPA152081_36100 [Pseudomonas aeruginosa]|nr:hypothetical protein VNPA141826_38730 [Pseudomonas aeruginosa]GLF78537.1 hypothetical protein VNPA152081_36100 [Pseudomonas aeruginosa]